MEPRFLLLLLFCFSGKRRGEAVQEARGAQVQCFSCICLRSSTTHDIPALGEEFSESFYHQSKFLFRWRNSLHGYERRWASSSSYCLGRFWLLQDRKPSHSGHSFLFKNRYKCVTQPTHPLALPGPAPPPPERTMWSLAQGTTVLAVIPALHVQYLIEITAT